MLPLEFGRKNNVNYKGMVKNSVVVLAPEVQLPEGAEVNVEPLELLPEDDPFLAAVLKLTSPALAQGLRTTFVRGLDVD